MRPRNGGDPISAPKARGCECQSLPSKRSGQRNKEAPRRGGERHEQSWEEVSDGVDQAAGASWEQMVNNIIASKSTSYTASVQCEN